MTRAEHLQWAKERAIAEMEYTGQPHSALASMGSDLGKHPELADHPGTALGLGLFLAGGLRSLAEMKTFIEGFH